MPDIPPGSGETTNRPRSHKELQVWQRSMDLAVAGYKLSAKLPKHELYGLTGQLTRALASVPANIAEGDARATRRDYASFIAIARGSLVEAETFVLLAVRLGYLTDHDVTDVLQEAAEVNRMLLSLHRRLRAP